MNGGPRRRSSSVSTPVRGLLEGAGYPALGARPGRRGSALSTRRTGLRLLDHRRGPARGDPRQWGFQAPPRRDVHRSDRRRDRRSRWCGPHGIRLGAGNDAARRGARHGPGERRRLPSRADRGARRSHPHPRAAQPPGDGPAALVGRAGRRPPPVGRGLGGVAGAAGGRTGLCGGEPRRQPLSGGERKAPGRAFHAKGGRGRGLDAPRRRVRGDRTHHR